MSKDDKLFQFQNMLRKSIMQRGMRLRHVDFYDDRAAFHLCLFSSDADCHTIIMWHMDLSDKDSMLALADKLAADAQAVLKA